MSDINLVFQPPQNATGFINTLYYINDLTDVGFGGVIGIGIVLISFAVILLMSKAFQFEKGVPVAMTITSFIAILLAIIGLLSDKIIYICLVFLIFSLFILFRGADRTGF